MLKPTVSSVIGPPKFRKKIQDMAIMVDETVRIEVDIDGTPKPEVKW